MDSCMALMEDWDVSTSGIQMYPSHPALEYFFSSYRVWRSKLVSFWWQGAYEHWRICPLRTEFTNNSSCHLLPAANNLTCVSQLCRLWIVSQFFVTYTGLFFVMRWLEYSGCITDLYFLISEFNVWNTNALTIFMDAIKKINSLVMTTDELFFLIASFFS